MSEQERTESTSKLVKNLAGLGGLVSGLIGLGIINHVINTITVGFETLKVYEELKELMGKDWADACMEDEECFKIMERMAEETLEMEVSMPREEREKYKKKLLDELVSKLREIGVEFYCDEKDFGELGEYYEDCYVIYKGEQFSITRELYEEMSG